jgi:hypothetical protein
MNIVEIMNMVGQFKNSLADNLKVLECIFKEIKLVRRFNELEFGRLRDEVESEARDSDQLPYIFEDTLTDQHTEDLHEALGYYGRDGFVANLGDDPFQIVLVGKRSGNQTSKFTVPPSTSYAIKSPISKVIIYPVAATAVVQISLQ